VPIETFPCPGCGGAHRVYRSPDGDAAAAAAVRCRACVAPPAPPPPTAPAPRSADRDTDRLVAVAPAQPRSVLSQEHFRRGRSVLVWFGITKKYITPADARDAAAALVRAADQADARAARRAA
jgi:hypothetical protein